MIQKLEQHNNIMQYTITLQ